MTIIHLSGRSEGYFNHMFAFAMLFCVMFFTGCAKKEIGKAYFPSSLVMGDSSHSNFDLQDSLGPLSSIFPAATGTASKYNVDNVGLDEISISVTNYTQMGFGEYSHVKIQSISNSVYFLADANGQPLVLNESDTINLFNGNWQSGIADLSTVINSNSIDPWYNQQEKYIGVKIGDYQLGWIKLSVSLASPGSSYQYVLVHEIGGFN